MRGMLATPLPREWAQWRANEPRLAQHGFLPIGQFTDIMMKLYSAVSVEDQRNALAYPSLMNELSK